MASSAAYHAEVGVLFDLFTFTVDGRVDEQIDRKAGSYRVVVAGEGSGITNRIESTGAIVDGRLVPTLSASHFTVRGRESQTRIGYDYQRRLVHYRHTSQTFFLGRQRLAEDVLGIPAGQRVDDIVSTALNYADGVLEVDATGAYRALVVRRKRPEREGPDDVQAGVYRAEIVPLRFNVTREREGGGEVCFLDLTRFSSWATPSKPARIGFGRDRRPESIEVALILGTRVKITFHQPS